MSARATDLDRAVAHRLRERRVRLGLTQQDLAQRVGVSYQQLHKYETGANRMSVGRMVEIAAALGATASEMLQGIGAGDAPRLTREVARAHRATIEMARDFGRLDPRTRRAIAVFVRALAPREGGR